MNPTDVECPYCGATPGYPCRNPQRSVTVARPGNPHASRRALARETESSRVIRSDPKTVERLLDDLRAREEHWQDQPHNNPVPGSRRAARQGHGT